MDGLKDNAKIIINKGLKEGFVLGVEKRDHIIEERGIKLHLSVSTNIIKKEKDKRTGDVFDTIRPEILVKEFPDFLIIPNYYAILSQHLLIISRKFVHQLSVITLPECNLLSKLLNEDYIICYNCGPGSGASQIHRHFHLILSLNSYSIPLGHVLRKKLFNELFPTSSFKFYTRNHEAIFEKESDDSINVTPEELLDSIRRCKKEANIRICKTIDGKILEGWDRSSAIIEEDTECGKEEDTHTRYYKDDFSLIMCKYFCALFPRFPTAVHGRNLNSISFTGYVFVKNEIEFDNIIKETILGTLSLATKNE